MNMVVNKKTSVFNTEPGNDNMIDLGALGLNVIGIKDILGGGKIVFSLNSNTGLDEIGLLDEQYDYTAVIQQDLGFNPDFPFAPSNIQVEYNFQGDLIVAFTDNLNTPKIVNLTNPPSPFNLSQIQLFPSFTNVICDSEVIENGGSLPAGTYYPVFRYENNDGTKTSYGAVNNPVYIVPSNGTTFNQYQGSVGGAGTTKSIQFILTNVDTTYDRVVLGIIYKSNGQVSTYEVGSSNTGSSVTITYSGSEDTTAIDLAAVLVGPAFYKRIAHFTQVQGTLYGADVSENALIDLQPYASMVTMKFKSELINITTLQTSYKVNAQNNKKKAFAHQEVYALYLIGKLKSGGWTQAATIPGRPSTSIEGSITGNETDLNSSLVGQDSTLTTDITIDANSKYYQTRDTSRSLDNATKTGILGYWENEDEIYPNLDSFDSSGIGGEDLRGKPVRHHRFPSNKKCRETFYEGNNNYGITQLDALSLVIDSFPTIPDEILDQIEGFQILYAKRTYANMTVCGNDLVLNGARRQGDDPTNVNTNPIYNSGGNWNNTDTSTSSGGIANENIIAYQKWLRLHSFNLVLNKPAISPSYLSNQFLLQLNNIGVGHTIEFDEKLSTIVEAYDVNYLNTIDAVTSDLAHSDEFQFAISNYKYVPNNTLDGQINNYNSEAFIFAQIDAGNNRLPYTNNRRFDPDTHTTSPTLTSETTYFTTIMQYKRNVYTSFYNQNLAATGFYWTVGNTPTQIYGGDTFLNVYGFVTFAPVTLRDIPNSQKPYASGPVALAQGVKTVRRYLCECTDNIGFRYEVPGDPTTYYAPFEQISGQVAWFLTMNVGTDPNNIAYDKDFSDVNDLNPFTPLNPYAVFEDNHPYRIIRSIPPTPTQQVTSWRNYLANDYYELRKDKGLITNIQGINNDLLINLQTTILKTIANQKLNAQDATDVYVGSGDIFARPPEELRTDDKGYGGCQHRFSCLLTPAGYFFVDQDAKKVFLVADGLKDITDGLYFEFLNKMTVKQDNPYEQAGYTVAWDSYYERIILAQLAAEDSFTWSYTPEKESWSSRHQYTPDLLFNDRTGFYSLKDNVLWKHNSKTNKASYYGTIFPSWVTIVDRILPPKRDPYEPRDIQSSSIDQLWTGLNWKTEVYLDGVLQRNLTINQLCAWTSYQSTGNITVLPFDRTKSLVQNQDSNTRAIKDRWIFNKLRDAVVDETQLFIDENYQSIEANIDQTQDFRLKRRLADDFIAVKFLFSNEIIDTLQPDCFLTDIDTQHSPIVR